MTKTWTWTAAPPHWSHPARRIAATILRAASRMLARLAARIAVRQAATASSPWPSIEFHCEAGAPEGALFVDGERIGSLPGVTRL